MSTHGRSIHVVVITVLTEAFGVGGLSHTRLSVSRLHRSPCVVPQLLSQTFLLVRQLEVGFVGCVPVERSNFRGHVTPAPQTHPKRPFRQISLNSATSVTASEKVQLSQPNRKSTVRFPSSHR